MHERSLRKKKNLPRAGMGNEQPALSPGQATEDMVRLASQSNIPVSIEHVVRLPSLHSLFACSHLKILPRCSVDRPAPPPQAPGDLEEVTVVDAPRLDAGQRAQLVGPPHGGECALEVRCARGHQ